MITELYIAYLSCFVILAISIGLTLILEYFCVKRYRYPLLSVLSAKLYISRHFKWLVMDIWGNSEWYNEIVLKKLRQGK